MASPVGSLLSLYERERAAGRPMALALVLNTAGSTYSKSGSLLLIAAAGEYAGLLSGGCLEGDLRERAQDVIATGKALRISYDMRGPEDQLWGLGAGCEGAMDILLLRVGPDSDWEPLAHMQESLRAHRRTALGIVTESRDSTLPAGTILLSGTVSEVLHDALQTGLSAVVSSGEPGWIEGLAGVSVFALPLALPPRILVLGAGPDALPVYEFARLLGWKLTLCDHRPAYAAAERFPDAERVLLARPEELAQRLDLSQYDAAVVMSHHLQSDLAYLRVLAHSNIAYVGLLGPAPRREKLRTELGAAAELLHDRLRSPVGLALGGRSSTSIALAIVAEIHAWLHGRTGGPFSGVQSGCATALPATRQSI